MRKRLLAARPNAVACAALTARLSIVLLPACGDDPQQTFSAPPAPVYDAGAETQQPAASAMQVPSDASSASDAQRAGDPPPSAQSSGPEAGLPPVSQLDPNVTFDWPEAKPGGARHCRGGTYSGRWTCNSFGLIPFEGDVSLQFTESMDGEFLELSDGRLGGLVALFSEGDFRFDGRLMGRLNCTTLEFSAEIATGEYKRYEPLTDTYEPVGLFEGTLKGTLDPEAQQIKGDWSLLADVLVDCVGPWTASFRP